MNKSILEKQYLAKLKKQFKFDKLMYIENGMFNIIKDDEIYKCYIKDNDCFDTSYRYLTSDELELIKKFSPNFDYSNKKCPIIKKQFFPELYLETEDFLIFKIPKYVKIMTEDDILKFKYKIIQLFEGLEQDGYLIGVNSKALALDQYNNVLYLTPFIHAESPIKFKILYNYNNSDVKELIVIDNLKELLEIDNEFFSLISGTSNDSIDNYKITDTNLFGLNKFQNVIYTLLMENI